MKLMHKIVQVKQWLIEQTYNDGKISFASIFKLIAKIRALIWIIKIMSKFAVFVISLLSNISPYLIAFFEFIENLASSLSYILRRRFFHGFYKDKIIWHI